MSSSWVEPELPLAQEGVVRARAADLQALAARYGISELRYASPGRLVGHVADDRDMLDMRELLK